jgi:general secretion pathway protein F
MPVFSYRAVTPGGTVQTGTLEVPSLQHVANQISTMGLGLIDAAETKTTRTPSRPTKPTAATRKAVTRAISEVATLVDAGLTLDRALTLALENINQPAVSKSFVRISQMVKEGVSLSTAMASETPLFSSMSIAMTEAGETSGDLAAALSKLVQSEERAEDLRQTLVSAMIYPLILFIISFSVILMMLLFVVPQFETLISTAKAGQLPPMTVAIMAVSRALRTHGLLIIFILAAVTLAIRQYLKMPSVRSRFDKIILKLPIVGTIITYSEAARFSRVLGGLVQGGVSLPQAMTISQRSLVNTHISRSVATVSAGLKEGGGLSGPLAATAVFPRMVIGFFRTGEETARLGEMLERLADILDKDVQTFIKRFIAILTPVITVVLGGSVAVIIASIMSAILGFNDLATGNN